MEEFPDPVLDLNLKRGSTRWTASFPTSVDACVEAQRGREVINKRVWRPIFARREIKRFHASNVEFFGWMGIQRHMGNQLGYYRGSGVVRPHRLRATGDRLDGETSHACFLSTDACALCVRPCGTAPPRKRGGEGDGNRKSGIWVDFSNRGEEKGIVTSCEICEWLRSLKTKAVATYACVWIEKGEVIGICDWLRFLWFWEIAKGKKESLYEYWWMIKIIIIIILESIGSLKMKV